ncbi:MAG: glycosyltransferase [Geminicoccaceae bacterium]|nr:glycosyltransferase [Geminicoccaceae bacterium]
MTVADPLPVRDAASDAKPKPDRKSVPVTDPVSVVVPVMQDRPEIAATHALYAEALGRCCAKLQFVYVLDGDRPAAMEALLQARRAAATRDAAGASVSLDILHLPQAQGEAAALAVAFRHAAGAWIVTLPDHPQVVGDELRRLVEAGLRHDLVVVDRQAPDRPAERQFEKIVRLFLGTGFRDLRSGVRMMRKAVAEEIVLYGDQHNFLPILAQSHGFAVAEIPLEARASQRRPIGLKGKPSLLLDVLTAFFIIRFVRKPFRFFGGIGLAIFVTGGLITAWLVFARLFLGVALIDRPALILSSLLVVLGIQIVSVGLIGEIITFAYTKEQKDYRVARIIE